MAADSIARIRVFVLALRRRLFLFWRLGGGKSTGRAGNTTAGKMLDYQAANGRSDFYSRVAAARLCGALSSAVETRNPRSVWLLSHEPTKEKHFAAFPGELVRRCLAGLVGGGCSACGTPFAPLVETSRVATRPGTKCKDWRSDDCDPLQQRSEASPNRDPERHIQRTEITGWRPCCGCGAGKTPLTVLDPFAGTGTVGRVANYLGLDSVLIELSESMSRSCDGI